MTSLVTEVQRLTVAPDEVLVVRPKGLLTTHEHGVMHRNLRLMAKLLDIEVARIIVLDRDIDLTVVKAEQMELMVPAEKRLLRSVKEGRSSWQLAPGSSSS